MIIPKYIKATNFLSFETLYHVFKEGTTTCIMGNNLTDEGQKSNGSGKSAIQNAVEFAYKGDFSRKINKASLIRRGEKELMVESLSFNNIKNEYLIIRRFLPVKGSERISVFLFTDIKKFNEDEDQFKVEIATVNDANKWIEEYLGVSKEDLSNFFFPNEITYKSFFEESDTKNKQLIGRFSNAEIADRAFPKIQIEVDKINLKIVEKERELLKLETNLETRQSDLSKEQERDFDKEKKDAIEIIKIQITTLKDDINRLILKVRESTESIKKLSLNAYETTKTLSEKQNEIEIKLKSKKDFSDIENKYKEELQKSETKINETDKFVDEVKSDKLDIEKDIRKIELSLSGKITCPKCSHEFILDSDFTVEELNSKIKEYKEELEEVLTDIEKGEKLYTKYKSKKDEIKAQINSISEEEKEYKKQLKVLENQQETIEDELSDINNDIKKEESNIKFYDESIKSKNDSIVLKEQSIKDVEATDYKKLSKEKELKSEIKEYNKQIKSKNEEITELVKEQEEVKKWELYYKNFKSYLANKKLKVIEGMMNKFLADMSTDFQIKLEGYTTVNNGKDIREKITPYIFKDSQMYGYHEFSKGERTRMNMANLLTLQTIINETSKTGGLSLIFPDEIFEGIDEEGLGLLLKSMQNTKKTVMITTHVTNEKIHDNILMVEKVNGISKILN